MNADQLVLSDDQQRALELIEEFVALPGAREMSLGGLAGTGKTTLVSLLLARGPVVLAPTAKACAVLGRKGVPASTLHSALYHYEGVDSSGKRPVLDFSSKTSSFGSLVIVDESSMVTAPVADELREAVARRGGRILWVGDHGQLPPVGEDPGILRDPTVRLEKIHRQAESSMILRVALEVRGGRRLFDSVVGLGASTNDVRAFSCPTLLHLEDLLARERPDVVLVARNETRRAVNRIGWRLYVEQLRAELPRAVPAGLEYPAALPGMPVMALRNNRKHGLVNGEAYAVEALDPRAGDDEYADVTLRDWLGGLTAVTCWLPALGRGTDDQLREASAVAYDVALLDYSFAATVHKAQGAEFPHVLVVDEPGRSDGKWDSARWAYTAATRAKQRLTVVRLGR